MSDATTSLTLENQVPVSFGSVTYFIQDNSGKQVNITVPALGSVQHPTDPAQGPWQIYATVNSPGSLGKPGSSLSSAPWTFDDPSAVVPSFLSIALNPAAPDPTPAPAPASGTAPDAAGFAPSLSPSILDSSRGWKSVGDTLSSETTPADATTTFRVRHQEQDNWCWAALAVSVEAFYTRTTPRTQCSLVNTTIGRTDCCERTPCAACNTSYSIGRGLSNLNCLNGSTIPNSISFSDVRTQIADSKPIGIRVLWAGGSTTVGHALSIYGYKTENLAAADVTIDVSDPTHGLSTVKFARFPANYHGGVFWTHTYKTKAPS